MVTITYAENIRPSCILPVHSGSAHTVFFLFYSVYAISFDFLAFIAPMWDRTTISLYYCTKYHCAIAIKLELKVQVQRYVFMQLHLSVTRVEMSCRSPGWNSWDSFSPSFSQAFRKTFTLSWNIRTDEKKTKAWKTRETVDVCSDKLVMTNSSLKQLKSTSSKQFSKWEQLGVQPTINSDSSLIIYSSVKKHSV